MRSGADDSNAAASLGCAVPGLVEAVKSAEEGLDSASVEFGSIAGDESENIVEELWEKH